MIKLFAGLDFVVAEDGRTVHDVCLVRVKSLAESNGRWDLHRLLATVPADQALRSLDHL
jgi:branched-chain amino acid transport system substrate-binding protein